MNLQRKNSTNEVPSLVLPSSLHKYRASGLVLFSLAGFCTLFAPPQASCRSRLHGEKGEGRNASLTGFSLLEIIIVIGLLVGVYTYALPQFRLFTGLELSSTLNRLAVDIRSAYDIAVLTGRVHRMVFQLENGEYWLEVADRNDVFLGVAGLDRDLTTEEEEEERLAFAENFKVYEDMLGEAVHDPEENVDIIPLTPLIAAKERLQKPQWTMIKNLEWQKRQVGPLLAITEFQAEHHSKKQTREDGEEHMQGYLYFFPDGYVERAIIQLAPLAGENEVDRAAVPYTVKTDPYNGTATITSGREELDS